MNRSDERTLSCQRIVELVTDYVEGVMAPDERDLFQLHLDTCPHCVVYVRQMRLAIQALGGVRADDFAEPVQQELVEIFRTWKADRQGGDPSDDLTR